LCFCSTVKKLTNRPLPLSETIKAHKWAQPVILFFTSLRLYVSPPAALEGEAAGDARGEAEGGAEGEDTADHEQQRVREDYETASGNWCKRR
jgi:hypothetical protein